MRMIALLIFSNIIIWNNSLALDLFTGYTKQSPEENVQKLTVNQINDPTDPYVNYNLGVAFYQLEKFDQAKNNFQRALLHAKTDAIKERSHFNLGNSCYKYALKSLPSNWQESSVEIDQDKIMSAIGQVQEAIKSYENVLEINKINNHAKTNLAKAKDILKKLQAKLKQQQNKDQNKDQDNKQDKKQDQDNKSQDQKSSEDGKKDRDKQNQQQNPAQNNQNSSDKSGDKTDSGDQKKSEQEKSQNEKQQDLKHNQNQSNQDQSNQSQAEQEQSNQQKEQNQEDAQKESKSAKAMLDNLQNYETNLQKARVLQKTQDGQKALTSSQKPW